MSRKLQLSWTDVAFALFVIFVGGFVLGTTLAPPRASATYFGAPIRDQRSVMMILPAVDDSGNGVVAALYTTVKPGTGKILFDTSSVLNYPDTQLAARTAAHVAADFTGVDLSTVDVEYSLDVNASIIEGPSAGAAMTLSVIMAMKNTTSPDHIAITGTIQPDGSIGQVGAVPEKAKAVKDIGVTTFIVPRGQTVSEDSQRVRTCNLIGSMNVCRVTYEPKTIDIGSSLNMTVHEVSNIAEAFSYFNTTA